MQLVLIDNRIKDVETVIRSLLNNVDFIIVDYENDTYDSIISKIPSKVYNSVGIFQENYELNNYQLIKSFSNSVLTNVSSDDPNLATWSQYKNLLTYFKNTLQIDTLDLMGCNIHSSLDWKYIIKYLEDELNININSSNDLTGSPNYGGNWILEDGNINLVGKYFSDNINKYEFTLGGFTLISTVLDTTNTVYGCGRDPYGWLFSTGTNTIVTFTTLTSLNITDVSKFSVGYSFIAAIKTDGSLWCRGLNNTGNFGIGNQTNSSTFIKVFDPSNNSNKTCVSVACCDRNGINNSLSTLAVLSDGSVIAAGSGSYGQIGSPVAPNGFTFGTTYNPALNSGVRCVDVKCGQFFSILLMDNGTVIGYGQNHDTLFGVNPVPAGSIIYNPITHPTKNSNDGSDLICSVIAAGTRFTQLLMNDGSVWGAGSNNGYQVGITTSTAAVTTRTQIYNPGEYNGIKCISVACGEKRTVFLMEDGSVWWIGGNINIFLQVYDPLGNSGKRCVKISCSLEYVQIIIDDGTCWAGPNIGGANVSSLGTGSGTFTSSQKLPGGSTYFCAMVMTNMSNGKLLADSSSITIGGDPPTDLYASVSERTAIISFTPGASSGSDSVISYKYSININGNGYGAYRAGNWIPGATSVTVSELPTGTLHFKLKAFNGADSPESGDSNDIYVNNFAPAAPTAISASVSSGIITVNFTPGVVNGSNAIYRYDYSVNTNGGGFGTFTTSNWSSGTSFTVSGLTIGNNYSFIIKSFNDIFSSESPASNALTVPNFAPTAPRINSASVSGRTITINFTAGTPNGSNTITSYKYAYSTTISGTYTFTTSTWTSGTTVVIPNLNTGPYYFKLKANNGFDSLESNTSSLVTVANYAPERPSDIITSVFEKTATIRFTPGVANGSNAITRYDYAVSTNGGAYGTFTTSNWSSGNNTFTVSGLIIDNNYSFKLKSFNGILSAESPASSAVTVENFAPTTPTNIIVTQLGRGVRISFTPGTSNGSKSIRSYKYAVNINEGGFGDFTTSNWTSGTSFTVAELTIDYTYSFKLIANNDLDSPESYVSNSLTILNPPPDPPTNLNVTVSVERTATISFTPGSSNGLDIVSYSYYVSSNDVNYESGILSNWELGTTSLTVSNLSVGTYYFKLTANNGTDSILSSASAPVTVSNFAPEAPTDITASVSVRTATINFTAGTPNGSNTITSYKYAVSINGGIYGAFINSNWTSGTSFTVLNLSSGNYYFKLMANNGINSVESTVSNEITVTPNAPTSINLSVTAGTGTITFIAGASNGSTITSYKYAVSINGGEYGGFITSNWTSGSSFTVSGLNAGNAYNFKVRSRNSINIESPDSIASNQVTVANFSPPAPTTISAIVSSGTATITFTPGVANGSNAIIRYDYSLKTNGGAFGNFTTSNWSSGTSFTVPGLIAGNNYSFKIKSFNGILSSESPVSTSVTVANFAPATPTNVIASISVTTATITFTPGVANGSNAITRYDYSLKTNGGGFGNFTTSNWSAGTSFTIPGLIIGNTYIFKIKGFNGILGSESSESNTISVAPSAPVIKTVILSGPTSVVIRFNQEATNASDISSYKYAFKTTNGEQYLSYIDTNLSWTSGSYSLTIDNLSGGGTYNFKLKACKNDIDSIESNESNGIFINYAPATPQISSIDAFDRIAIINFSITNNGSNAVTKYMYSTDNIVTNNSVFYDFPLINDVVQTTSPLIINRLINGTTYSFTIKAFNDINSQASNTINDIYMTAAQKPARIISGKLKDEVATLYIQQPIDNRLEPITNYAYSTNGINYIPLNPFQTTSPLIITGISGTSTVSFTIKSINISAIFSQPSNQIKLVPLVRQPAPIIATSGLIAKDDIARIPFSQTLISNNGDDAIIKYVYCKDTNITGSSVFIDVPLLDENVQTTSPFVIPYTVINPANTTSLSFTFKSFTLSNIYSLASTTAIVSPLYTQPPPTITSAIGDGKGTATITINQLNTNSYAPQITNYAFSTDGTNFKYFSPAKSLTTSPFTIYGLNDTLPYSFTFKCFNGSYSEASNTVTNVLTTFPSPLTPVITYASGSQGTAIIYFSQDISNLTKELTGVSYSLNNNSQFTNLTISSSSRSFTISGLTASSYTIKMRTTNGAFSNTSNTVSFIMTTINRATYVDPLDI